MKTSPNAAPPSGSVPHRIYADFNGLSGEAGKGWTVGLDTFGTLRELANAGVRLTEGLALLIHDESDEDEDLEADATAHFDSERGIWWAEIGAEGYRCVPKRERNPSTVFLCVACRHRLDEHIKAHGLQIGDLCPSCATPIHAPLIPPDGISALGVPGLARKPPP